MVFSKQEREMLEKITHHLLESLDFFINSLINELNQYELHYNDNNVKYKRFLLYICLISQFLFSFLYIENLYVYPFGFLIYFFVNIIISLFATYVVYNLNKILKYYSRLGNYRIERKKIILFKNQIQNISKLKYLNDFESILEIQDYINNISTKSENYLNFFKNLEQKRGRIFYGLSEIIITISISIMGSISLYIYLIYFKIDISQINLDFIFLLNFFIPLQLIIRNLLPNLSSIYYQYSSRINKLLRFLLKSDEFGEYYSKFAGELLNEIYFVNLRNFRYKVLCNLCKNPKLIQLFSKTPSCDNCNSLIDFTNKVIELENFVLEYYCIKCGHLINTKLDSINNNIFECSNCNYEREFTINQLLFKVIEKVIHSYKESGFIYPQIASNKDVYFLLYYDNNNKQTLKIKYCNKEFKEDFLKIPLDVLIEGLYFLPDVYENITNSIVSLKNGSRIMEPVFTKLDLRNIIYNMKGPFLEIGARELFRNRDLYDMKPSGLDWNIDFIEVIELLKMKCIRDKSTTSIQIDLYGKKEEKGRRIYLIGECKFKKKYISPKEFKCFVRKASIIAAHKLSTYEKKHHTKPLFHLIIISMGGFLENINVDQIIKDFWKLKRERIYQGNIELIDDKNFIKQLKENDISASIYKQIKKI